MIPPVVFQALTSYLVKQGQNAILNQLQTQAIAKLSPWLKENYPQQAEYFTQCVEYLEQIPKGVLGAAEGVQQQLWDYFGAACSAEQEQNQNFSLAESQEFEILTSTSIYPVQESAILLSKISKYFNDKQSKEGLQQQEVNYDDSIALQKLCQ